MPSSAHELAVLALGDDSALLTLLLEKLAGIHLPAALTREDANVRFTKAVEVRPDLLLRAPDGYSLAVEVEGKPHDEKGRRWGVLMAVLHDGSGVMGDLVIVTCSPRVARWAKRVGHVRGRLGTTSTLTPIVLLLSGAVLEALLDEAHPELAFFAAWAMQNRHGPRARRTVERALAVTKRLPARLREVQQRAIYQVLSAQMVAFLEEATMDISKFPPELPRTREVRLKREAIYEEGEAAGKAEGEAKGEARGKAEGVLAVLAARGLAVSDAEREQVRSCTDGATLDRWIARAVTAGSVAEALA